tara:strand:+ start:329 stop:697 length:369 start_codon:yes stop_codon:yes gene_type:complete
MTNFIYDFTDTGVTIQTDTYCHYFDSAKSAADAAYALLKGESTDDWDNNQIEHRVDEWHGDENDLLWIVQNYDEHKDENVKYIKLNILHNYDERTADRAALFASVFFEEVHLAFYIRGLINE